MKRLIWALAATAAVSLVAMFVWGRFTTSVEGVETEVARGAVSSNDELAAGQSVGVHEAPPGDLALAGRDVVVSAPVDGYVMAAGEQVSIGGDVSNDLWAAGRRVVVDAAVGDNARVAGAEVLLAPDAEVTGNALLAGASVEVRAPVHGDLAVGGNRVLLASPVDGSVEVQAASVELTAAAAIGGDLVVRSPNPPDIAPGADIAGEVRHIAPADDAGGRFGAWLFQWLFGFLALLALGVVTLAPAPRWSANVAARVGTRFGASLLTGLVALLVAPIAIAIFAVTVVGIPIAIVGLAFLIALLLLSGVFVALRLGAWITGRRAAARADEGSGRRPRFGAFAIGAALLALVASLPWIGWIAWVVVPIVGVGALLLERNEAMRAQQPSAVEQPA